MLKEMRLSSFALSLLAAVPAFSQVPQIAPGGVVNAASYAQPIAPGSLVSIFGTNLASSQAVASGSPLPTSLAGTSVNVNGVPAPLLFVSPGQINVEIPSSLETSYRTLTSASVTVTTASGTSTAVDVPAYTAAPAAFTPDSSGCGQAAALNVAADGGVTLNSPDNSAAPGDFVSLYGTGWGLPTIAVPDGSSSTGPDPLQTAPGLWLDGTLLPGVAYAGLAPGLPGGNQINFQIPAGTREGCAVPVAIQAGARISPVVSLSIHSGGGRCVDPPDQSYGHISLTKTVASGTANDGTNGVLAATFPSGPGLKPVDAPTVPPGTSITNVTDPVPVSRTCAVNGDRKLSAGAITVQAAGTGQTITSQPLAQVDGVSYEQSLPSGFTAPGQYTVSASGGSVTFQGTVSVPAPIEIQTALPPGTQISTTRPFTIHWTGGNSNMRVKAMLIAKLGEWSPYNYTFAPGDAGSIAFQPLCSGNPPICSFGLPATQNAEVILEISPAPGSGTSLPGQGVTGTVEAAWSYRYVFGGLVFAP